MKISPWQCASFLCLAVAFESLAAEMKPVPKKIDVKCTVAPGHEVTVVGNISDATTSPWKRVGFKVEDVSLDPAVERLGRFVDEKGVEHKEQLRVESSGKGVTASYRWTDFDFKGAGTLSLSFDLVNLQEAKFEVIGGALAGIYSIDDLSKFRELKKAPNPPTAIVIRNWAGVDLLVRIGSDVAIGVTTTKPSNRFELRLVTERSPLSTGAVGCEVSVLALGEKP